MQATLHTALLPPHARARCGPGVAPPAPTQQLPHRHARSSTAGEDPPLNGTPPPGRERTPLSPYPVVLGVPSLAADTTGAMLASASTAECALEGMEGAGGEARDGDGAGEGEEGVGRGMGAGGTVLHLPRCGTTLQLCESTGVWSCPACDRRWVGWLGCRTGGRGACWGRGSRGGLWASWA